MKKIINIVFSNAISLINSFTRHLNMFNNHIVKSDNENIDILLENDSDKVIFENTVTQLLKENKKSKNIVIKNKTVTISI